MDNARNFFKIFEVGFIFKIKSEKFLILITLISINPKLTYYSGENNRINFIYKLSNIDNSIGNQESLKQQNFGISLFLNQKDKTGFISEFNYFKNEFRKKSFSKKITLTILF